MKAAFKIWRLVNPVASIKDGTGAGGTGLAPYSKFQSASEGTRMGLTRFRKASRKTKNLPGQSS